MEYVAIYDKEFLEHHGVLGQKWGVRRYQDANGRLTDEGIRHYGRKVNQGHMSEKKRDVYAEARTERLGKSEAVRQEEVANAKSIAKKETAKAAVAVPSVAAIVANQQLNTVAGAAKMVYGAEKFVVNNAALLKSLGVVHGTGLVAMTETAPAVEAALGALAAPEVVVAAGAALVAGVAGLTISEAIRSHHKNQNIDAISDYSREKEKREKQEAQKQQNQQS